MSLEAVAKNPEIAFGKLVAAVKKAGYKTKEISIKAEYLKTRRSLAKKPKGVKKAVGKPVQKKQADKTGGKGEDESCTGLTEEPPAKGD